MEKTSREYAEKLAKEMFNGKNIGSTKHMRKIAVEFYLKAVEETNVKELIEACETALKYFNGFDTSSQSEAAFHALNNVIKKTNK